MFERLDLLIGYEKRVELKNINILIVGLGGVGGACFEALVRAGIGNITVIDNDVFDLTNLNRQLLSNRNNIGNSKVMEAKKRALEINPLIDVEALEMFIDNETIKTIDFSKFDYIVDCCDMVNAKCLLIKYALENEIKIICACGTGNRTDATKLIVTDIFKTNYDPLARVLRKKLKDFGIKKHIPVVTSTEIPCKNSVKIIASCSIVPNTAGFYLASYVFNDIINARE